MKFHNIDLLIEKLFRGEKRSPELDTEFSVPVHGEVGDSQGTLYLAEPETTVEEIFKTALDKGVVANVSDIGRSEGGLKVDFTRFRRK